VTAPLSLHVALPIWSLLTYCLWSALASLCPRVWLGHWPLTHTVRVPLLRYSAFCRWPLRRWPEAWSASSTMAPHAPWPLRSGLVVCWRYWPIAGWLRLEAALRWAVGWGGSSDGRKEREYGPVITGA